MQNNQKRTETSLHKKISKKKSRDASMNALADQVHKQEVSCMHTVICTPYHGHIIQQPSLNK